MGLSLVVYPAERIGALAVPISGSTVTLYDSYGRAWAKREFTENTQIPCHEPGLGWPDFVTREEIIGHCATIHDTLKIDTLIRVQAL